MMALICAGAVGANLLAGNPRVAFFALLAFLVASLWPEAGRDDD